MPASEMSETDEVIGNLVDTLKKIRDHGKRADSVVKGMLQHSRVNPGKKELTDLNALADKYLRLCIPWIRVPTNQFKEFHRRLR
jgi:hypothetical protein